MLQALSLAWKLVGNSTSVKITGAGLLTLIMLYFSLNHEQRIQRLEASSIRSSIRSDSISNQVSEVAQSVSQMLCLMKAEKMGEPWEPCVDDWRRRRR